VSGLRIAILVLVCASAWGDEAYPVARRGGLSGNLWTNVGVDGGHRRLVTTIYTNITDLAITETQLNTVLNQNCPSNQVVQLTNGTFTRLTNGPINLTKSGVVLRGTTNANGHPITFLNKAGINHSTAWYASGPNGGWPAITTRTITAGLSEGSTSITVSSPPNADFAPGDVFMIDQTFDGTTVTDDTQSDSFSRNTRPFCEVLHIVSTNATTITFEPPLLGTYWDTATRSPQAVGWSSSVSHNPQFVGIEDLDFPNGAVQEIYTLRLGPAYGSWVYNVRAVIDTSASIRASYLVNCAVAACTFHDTTGTGSGTYAMIAGPSTQCRYEDNISTNASLFMPTSASVGDSIAFNCGVGPYPYDTSAWLAETMFPHGGHTHHSIWEGNYVVNIYFDDVFANNNSDNGIVRNRIIGWATGKTQDTLCIALGEGSGTGNHRNTTILGNCLGENSYHTTYAELWHIAGVVTGTIRTNNFNTVDDAVPSSESMGGNTMLSSYVYSSKPAWFGDRPWPAFGPDVVNSTNALGYTNIPAGYRIVYGQWPPSAAGGGGGIGHNAKRALQSAIGGRRR
jgi:hypothetical protein